MANESHVANAPTAEAGQADRGRCGVCCRPNVDILDRDDEITVLADVPGASPEGIDVNFEDGRLTISADVATRHEGIDFLVREYGVGDYYRTFEVHEDLDPDKISAEYADGVLSVHLKKRETPPPKRVEVKVN